MSAASRVVELKDDRIREYRIKPQDFKLDLSDRDDLIVEEFGRISRNGKDSTNGGRSSCVRYCSVECGGCHLRCRLRSLDSDGVEAAWDVMESGEAMHKLALAELTQTLKAHD